MPLFKCWRHNVSQHLQSEILQIISSLAHPFLWGHLLALLTNWCWWRNNLFQTSFDSYLPHFVTFSLVYSQQGCTVETKEGGLLLARQTLRRNVWSLLPSNAAGFDLRLHLPTSSLLQLALSFERPSKRTGGCVHTVFLFIWLNMLQHSLHWSFTPPVVFNIYLYPLFFIFSFPFHLLQTIFLRACHCITCMVFKGMAKTVD